MFAEGYIPPGDVKLRCAPTQSEKLLYQRFMSLISSCPFCRTILIRITGISHSEQYNGTTWHTELQASLLMILSEISLFQSFTEAEIIVTHSKITIMPVHRIKSLIP